MASKLRVSHYTLTYWRKVGEGPPWTLDFTDGQKATGKARWSIDKPCPAYDVAEVEAWLASDDKIAQRLRRRSERLDKLAGV